MLLKKRFAEIDHELSLGHGKTPESMLNDLIKELSPAQLEAEYESMLRLLHEFQPKRRERLLEKLESAVPWLVGGKQGAARSSPNEAAGTTSDALAELAECTDGRVYSWEISRLRKRVDSRAEALELIGDQINLHRRAGDTLGAGEWSLARLSYVGGSPVSDVVAETLSAWSSPRGTIHDFEDLAALIKERAVFVEEDLASALGAMCLRFQEHQVPLPPLVSELAFKLKGTLVATLGIQEGLKRDLCPSAAASVATARASLSAAVESFVATTPATAKEASIELIKWARAYQRIALVAERPLLSEIPLLVGAGFRKLCEDYQRQNADGILNRIPGVREHVAALLGRADNWSGTRLWHDTVLVVANKVVDLADDVLASTQAATATGLRLASTQFKVDLTKRDRNLRIVARLLNEGPGRAKGVTLSGPGEDAPVALRVVEPKPPFDVSGQSQQLVRIEAVVDTDVDSVCVPIQWRCTTPTGANAVQQDIVQLIQQIGQPNWDELRDHPPYSHNAVKDRDHLFGRDEMLEGLELNSMAGNSCFVSGQKRIGKTSVLQVLAGELRKRKKVACVYLRMGEVKGLHEGQLSHRVAERFADEMDLPDGSVPAEGHFGASMARLIPWVERVVRDRPKWRLVLIIDEFDDLDPAYYTGQRGRKIRQTTPITFGGGLTFLFVGSERMENIYRRHENELNKWTNEYLDSIESRADCRELVVKPVSGSIEFDEASVEEVVDYCGRNPFYMHLLCYVLFQLCMREQKTYVSITDVAEAQERLMRTSGESNFAHYWNDNPTLSEAENETLAAQTCLVLAVISHLGGRFERVADLVGAQREMGLVTSEQLPRSDLAKIVSLLVKRRVLARNSYDHYEIPLPILHKWLARQAETVLLPKWRLHRDKCVAKDESEEGIEARSEVFFESSFPVSDDDLLAIAQPLTYLGRQVDVAQLRSWLLQFDDENRIEMAYSLLQRLATVGYVSEGAYSQKIQCLEEAVADKRRSTGRGAWREVRKRKDNLAITYVDGELKSGGALTRELRNRLRPGKVGRMDTLGQWLRGHADQDALLLVADDFAATGESLSKGLATMCGQHKKHLAPFFGRAPRSLLRPLRIARGARSDSRAVPGIGSELYTVLWR